ncbi:SDR family oxidoreductase [Schaalia sp. ZJ1691]|uniref:SDR family oxidoreductase n=1 Tax=Schaalia sp. ZJ1691 TaxID=2709404 RepID=UPI0013EAC2A7|nr:SDR family oxidoreductase [Schaalia sp. ZJ1691]
MKVFVAGASGRVGTQLVHELHLAGHEVVAASRHPESLAGTPHVEAVTFDVSWPLDDMTTMLDGIDAVYFTAGSRGKDLLRTDAFGAVKLMQASERAGIERFILLSSVFADRPEKWDDPALAGIMNYNIAKFFADQWLMRNTELAYTIVQPGNLVEDEHPTGMITTHVDHSQPNSIGNVARVLAGVLQRPNTYRRIITMADGDVPIDRALDMI